MFQRPLKDSLLEFGRRAAVGAFCFFLLSCSAYKPVGDENYIGPRSVQPAAQAQPAAPASKPASKPAAATAGTPASRGPLELTTVNAIVLGLENNQALRVERLNPIIQRTFEDQQRAAFDPVLGAELSKGRTETERVGPVVSVTDNWAGQITLNEFLPTGTSIALAGTTSLVDATGTGESDATRLGLSINQSLLRGFGLDVNLASLRQARLDTFSSQYELRGFAQSLVAQIESTYWDLSLAHRQIDIVTQSLKLAQQQLEQTQEYIKAGKLAGTEIAAARAEVALRYEELINARSAYQTTKLQFLRLINVSDGDFWRKEVLLKSEPVAPEIKTEPVEIHVEVAMRMRPDLNQARLTIQKGELELVKTRNGLLPQMDLFINLGKTGYAQSFGGTLRHLSSDDSHDVTAGVVFSYPLGNRSAIAQHTNASVSYEQSKEAQVNLEQLAQLDVRTAYIEVTRLNEQVAATAATRELQEETLRVETEKYRVGKSTALLVAQAQRDLLTSQIVEVRAMASYLKAFVNLYLLDGSLLERRGIGAPGREPFYSLGNSGPSR